MTAEAIEVHNHLRGDESHATLQELYAGLTGTPRVIPSRFFYDDVGSRLFERITEQPEYYQTRTEASILDRAATDIIERTRARDLVELGSGASTKTRILLDRMRDAQTLTRYVPVDVSEGILRRSAKELVELYPGLSVHAIIADFSQDLGHLPESTSQLAVFLGGTIGNFTPTGAVELLDHVRDALEPGSWLLLGTDLIKDPARIEAAYNDAAGVTAEFNRNILRVMNTSFDGNFDPESYEHHAFYNAPEHRIEMWLRPTRPMFVELPGIDVEFNLATGEAIRTELSTKFNQDLVTEMLAKGGFRMECWYPDPGNLFALSLARRL